VKICQSQDTEQMEKRLPEMTALCVDFIARRGCFLA
jgi:hypothetical protein